jgi:hypothetical protein
MESPNLGDHPPVAGEKVGEYFVVLCHSCRGETFMAPCAMCGQWVRECGHDEHDCIEDDA